MHNSLRPAVHTWYDRTSYIQKGDDSLRITLDENVRVSKEAGMFL